MVYFRRVSNFFLEGLLIYYIWHIDSISVQLFISHDCHATHLSFQYEIYPNHSWCSAQTSRKNNHIWFIVAMMSCCENDTCWGKRMHEENCNKRGKQNMGWCCMHLISQYFFRCKCWYLFIVQFADALLYSFYTYISPHWVVKLFGCAWKLRTPYWARLPLRSVYTMLLEGVYSNKLTNCLLWGGYMYYVYVFFS